MGRPPPARFAPKNRPPRRTVFWGFLPEVPQAERTVRRQSPKPPEVNFAKYRFTLYRYQGPTPKTRSMNLDSQFPPSHLMHFSVSQNSTPSIYNLPSKVHLSLSAYSILSSFSPPLSLEEHSHGGDIFSEVVFPTSTKRIIIIKWILKSAEGGVVQPTKACRVPFQVKG